MVDFVLDDLCCPPLKIFGTSLHLKSLVLHLDGLIPLALTGTTEQREASLFGIVRFILFEDDGVKHYGVCRGSSAFVQEGDDAFTDS